MPYIRKVKIMDGETLVSEADINEIYVAVYGETSYNDLWREYQAGQTLYVNATISGMAVRIPLIAPNTITAARPTFIFATVLGSKFVMVTIYDGSEWTTTQTDIGGGGMFFAQYNVTEFDDIKAAFDAGKTIYVYNPALDNLLLLLSATDDDNTFFAFASIVSYHTIYTSTDTVYRALVRKSSGETVWGWSASDLVSNTDLNNGLQTKQDKIELVANLPSATLAEFNKHKIYLHQNKLKYIVNNSGTYSYATLGVEA